jgi:hypothetical protein
MTWSFQMGGRDLVRIRPQPEKYCARFRQQAAAVCEGKSEDAAECKRQRRNLQTCQTALQQAFAHINLGGCTRPQQINAVCELEWCTGSGVSSENCRTECASVRQALGACIQEHVHESFHKHGLAIKSTKGP